MARLAILTDDLTAAASCALSGLRLGARATVRLTLSTNHNNCANASQSGRTLTLSVGQAVPKPRGRRPGRSVYLHAIAHATRDQEGQLEYIAAVQDVTARRLAEEALERA